MKSARRFSKAMWRSSAFRGSSINRSGYRHEELKLALEKTELLDEDKVFIIPVRLEKCEMPESLGRLQRVDLFEAGGYKKLIRALRQLEDLNQ